MAYVEASIPITETSPAIDSECTFYYLVEYRLSGDIGYSSFTTSDNPIVISPLVSEETYNVRITRYCCNGAISGTATTNVDTTLA